MEYKSGGEGMNIIKQKPFGLQWNKVTGAGKA